MENIHTEVRVQRVIVNVICRFESGDSIFLGNGGEEISTASW